MRWFVAVVFVLALGAGCDGTETGIPCETYLDCPDAENLYDCKDVYCQGGVCGSSPVGSLGRALGDGSVGLCSLGTYTEKVLGEIRCYSSHDGTLCRSLDGREGTCLDELCGSEDRRDGVICEANVCGSAPYCNWAGACEFRLPTLCNDANACTLDSCGPDIGCVNERAPNGAECTINVWCTLVTLGMGSIGTCQDGICEE